MDRSIIEKKILDTFKANPGRWYRPRTIMKDARIKEHDYRTLKILLLELCRTGRIEQKGRHQYAFKPKLQQQTGTLAVTSRGFGFVELQDGSEVFVRAQHMQHAFHKDLVRVQILNKQRGDKPEAQIIEVIQRHQTEFVGVYQHDRFGEWVVPEDKRIRVRFAVLEGKQNKARDGHMVSVELVRWEEGHPEPLVNVKDVLGYPGDPGVDIALIVQQHDLPTTWSSKALEQAESYSEQSVQDEIKHRTDLRHLTCFTIDPESAQDFDDAVSIETTKTGWTLGVHIADVSHYVVPGTPIDRGARKRGSSVYLVGTAIHMLPEKLASDLCSLKPHIDRLSMSCLMDIGRDGQFTGSKIMNSVIHSKQRFSYEEVEAIIQGKEHTFSPEIQEMEKLRKVLFKDRKSRGSIDLDLPEPIVILDETGFPHDIKPSKRLTAHRLVEEFMLAANRVTAEFLDQKFIKAKLPGIYRIHETPSSDDISKLQMILDRLKIPQKIKTPVKPKDYQVLVEAVRESPYRHFIEKVALRSMTKAKYSVENRGHFGLAFQSYTHFTSPIRRYPDLTVHRLLKQYIYHEHSNPPSFASLEKLAEHCSQRERVAVEAERDHMKMKQLQYLSKRIGQEFDGVISGVLNFGFFVELAESFVDGLVHAGSLTDDYYEYEENNFSLTGRRTKKMYRLGDPVRVKVTSVSISEGLADFEIIKN
ncbi:MAG: ribonuclease R [Candidatus Marinimicrobia bacterium]|nr:ribonuclease R [Candidatus Neomarinimicrobiota bacterium]MCF7922171.1 ribonuclease R [Candidatus Neomarinimicrobiota bacterium]